MQSTASTVAEYVSSLPQERRIIIEAVRQVFLANIDSDIEEGMGYGMISYYIPHRVYPAGYHCNPSDPLPYGGLASQKNHLSLYLMSIYGDFALRNWFVEAWKRTGKKLDMGKSCIRFKKLEDLPLEVLAETLRRVPSDRYIVAVEASRQGISNSRQAAPKDPEPPAAENQKPARSSAVKNSAGKVSTGKKSGVKKSPEKKSPVTKTLVKKTLASKTRVQQSKTEEPLAAGRSAEGPADRNQPAVPKKPRDAVGAKSKSPSAASLDDRQPPSRRKKAKSAKKSGPGTELRK